MQPSVPVQAQHEQMNIFYWCAWDQIEFTLVRAASRK